MCTGDESLPIGYAKVSSTPERSRFNRDHNPSSFAQATNRDPVQIDADDTVVDVDQYSQEAGAGSSAPHRGCRGIERNVIFG